MSLAGTGTGRGRRGPPGPGPSDTAPPSRSRRSTITAALAPSAVGGGLDPRAGLLAPAGATLVAGQFFQRPGHAAERGPEVGEIDHGEQEPDHPEDVHVREQGYKSQHRDDLELQLVRPVRHPFRQRVQAQEQVADREHGDNQENGHHRHQDVGPARVRDEGRQVRMTCRRIHIRPHWGPPSMTARIAVVASSRSRRHPCP